MKKLSKVQRDEWEAMTLVLSIEHEKLKNLVDHLNEIRDNASVDTIGALTAEIANVWHRWHSVAEDARSFAEQICIAAQDHFDEKSERWQESEKGEEYGSFIESWQEVADMENAEMSECFDEDGDLEAPEAPEDGPVIAAQMEPGE